MQRNKGFTLIELVVVIIILGILSVVAAPKFIDLKGDAHKATVEAMAGAIDSTNSLVYSKSAINGVEKEASIDAEAIGDEYAGATLIYGSMQSDETSLVMLVEGIDDPSAWEMEKTNEVNMRIHPADHPTIGDGPGNCFVQYSHKWTDARGATYPAKTTLYTDDC